MLLLKRLLAPPIFNDEEKAHQAYLLHIILSVITVLPILFATYIFIQKPEEANRTLSFIVVLEIINILLFIMLKRGYVRQAAIFQVITIWAFFAAASVTSSSIYGLAYTLGNALVITMAGVLLGGRSAFAMTLLSIIEGGSMVYAELHGWTPPDILDDALSTWIVIIILFAVGASLQNLAAREIRSALKRAHVSEERYRLISEVSSDYTFSTRLDSDGVMHLDWVAGAFEKMTGYTYEEYVASGSWFAHVHPDDIEKDALDMQKLHNNQDIQSEIRTLTKSGEVRWGKIFAHPIWDENENRLIGIIGSALDITEQKKIEASLAYEHNLLQIFMDNIPDTVWFKDTQSRFVQINQAQARFLGIDNPRDAIGKTDLDFQDIKLAMEFIKEEKQIIETNQPVLNRIEFNPTIDGKPRWLSTTKVPVKDKLGKMIGIIGLSRDFGEQKKIEDMLVYERDLLQIFMDHIPDLVYLKDTSLRFIRINKAHTNFLKLDKPEDAIGKTDLDFQPPNLAGQFMEEERQMLESGEPIINQIEFNPKEDGQPRWLSRTKAPVRDSSGLLMGTIGITRDVTEQKLAEEYGQRRRDMLEKIVKLGQYVTEVQDVRTTLQRIWHTVRNELDFDRLGIYLYNADDNTMNGSYGTSSTGEMLDEWDTHVPLTNENLERNAFKTALQDSNGMYVTHNYDVEHNTPKGNIMYGVKDFAAVAAWAGSKPVAVICVDQQPTQRPITDYQLEMLRLFAGYAGLGIENSRLKDAVESELEEKRRAEEVEHQRRQMLEKIIQLGKQVTEVADLQTTLERIWYTLHDDLGFDRIGIFFHNVELDKMDRALGTDINGQMDTSPLSIETGIFRAALETPDGYHFSGDYSTEYDIPEGHEMYGVRDHIEVAAWIENKPVAIIAVDQNITQRPITEYQVEALRLFAGYAGLGIENSRLKDALQNELAEQKQAEELEQRRRIIMEKVIRLGKQVTEAGDFNATLKIIWSSVRYDLDFDRVGLFLYNPQDNTMDGAYGTDRAGKIEEAWHVRIGLRDDDRFVRSVVFHKVLDRPDGIYSTKDYEGEFNILPGDPMAGVKYYAVVAAWVGEKPIAIIAVDQLITGRTFSDEQLEALRLLAGYVGLAIENSRLKEATLTELEEQKQAEVIGQRRRAMMEKVIQLGKRVAEVTDLQTTLERIWHTIHDDLNFDRLGIFFFNKERNSMDRVLGTDTQGNMDKSPSLWVPLTEWTIFNTVLEHPDGFYFTHNFSAENNIPKQNEMYNVTDYAAVAVWTDNQPMAAICVDNVISGRDILDEELEALRLFAGYAGLAIENSRLKDAIQNELDEQKQAEELEQRRRETMEKVIQLGKQVTEVQDIHTTLRGIWHNIHDDLNFDRLGIFLYNPETNSMDGTFGTNIRGELVEEWDMHLPLDKSIFESNDFIDVLQGLDGLVFSTNYDVERNIPKLHPMYGVKHYAAVAARAGDKPVAVICVDHLITGRPISSEQLEALRLFAGYAGLAIENSRLKDAIQNELSQRIHSEEQEKRRSTILEKVVKLGQNVTEVYDLRTTLMRIWHGVHDDLGFDRLGIRLYNPERNSMDGTWGTNNMGEIIDEWGSWISLDQDGTESRSLLHVLEKPGNISFTHTFENDYKVPVGKNMSGVKDHAAIGAWAGEKPVAIISVDHRITGRPITDEQLEALRLFAGYAGLAIENARLKDAIENELLEQKRSEEIEQRRRVMLGKVLKLGKQVTEVNDFHITLKKIWNGVRYDLDFDRVGLFLYNERENIMQGAYGTDRDGNFWDAWHIRYKLDKEAIFYKILSRPDGFFFTKDYEGEFNPSPDNDMAGVKYCAMVAVWAGDKPVAIISVDQFTTGRVITDEQLEALRLFAGYAGLAISNARLNDALEDELTQRQTFINELETKNAELERFTYTVSHDLKSPLVTITGFLGYLEKDALSGNTEKIKGSVNRISRAAEKMQELLNDLLELSRIGRLMNPPEDIPFEEIVNEAVEKVQGRLDEQNVMLQIQKGLPNIRGDRARLVEVMQNLIDNAAKYSEPNVQSVIEIGATQDQSSKIVYFVRDNGIGIDPQFHERVFGLFNKLNPHSEGTGIGLALIKRIIEVHNGKIWVESEAGKGSTFKFTLPKE